MHSNGQDRTLAFERSNSHSRSEPVQKNRFCVIVGSLRRLELYAHGFNVPGGLAFCQFAGGGLRNLGRPLFVHDVLGELQRLQVLCSFVVL